MHNFIMRTLAVLILTCGGSFVNAAEKAAKAIIVKGKVVAQVGDKEASIKRGQWLPEGAVVKTEKGSFAKLLFVDKSSINVGPASEMKIESFPKEKAGIISLVKGKIRSKVSKNYMKIKDKDQSKLFIKTKTAAMGVRGTDFQVSYNPENTATSLVTFEGRVAMARIEDGARPMPQRELEMQVSSEAAVMVTRGQFSGASEKAPSVSPPTKISPVQLETMEKNEVPGVSSAAEGSANGVVQAPKEQGPKKKYRNIVPPGVDAKDVANDASSVESAVAEVAGEQAVAVVEESTSPEESSASESEGAPRAGGYIDIETAQYVEPSADAVFDANTGVYTDSAEKGYVDPETGNYTNDYYTLNADGTFTEKEAEETSEGSDDASRSIASVGSDSGAEGESTPEPPTVYSGTETEVEYELDDSDSSSVVADITSERDESIDDFQNSDNTLIYDDETTTNLNMDLKVEQLPPLILNL